VASSNVLPRAQNYLLSAIATWQAAPSRVGAISKTRQLVTAMIGLAFIIALPVVLIYYARRRWRP